MIDAFNYIRLGKADVIVSGGSEACVNEMGMGGFNALKALSTRNESPETASRPFDVDRDGFVLGEGSGALILEEYEHAKNVITSYSIHYTKLYADQNVSAQRVHRAARHAARRRPAPLAKPARAGRTGILPVHAADHSRNRASR